MADRRTGGLRVALALFGVVLLPAPAWPGPAAAEEALIPEITAVGSLDRLPPEAVAAFGPALRSTVPLDPETGTLLPVPGAGQVWQVYPLFTNTPQTGILVRDAASLAVVGSFVVGDFLRRAALVDGGGEWLHAEDDGGRVWLVGHFRVTEVDVATLQVRALPAIVSEAERLLGFRLGGLSYDPVGDDLLALVGARADTSQANAVTELRRVDLATGEMESRVLRACTGPLPSTADSRTYGVPVLATAANFVVACQRRVPHDFGTRILTAMVRVPRATAFEVLGEEAHVEWPIGMEAALTDAVSGRIVLLDLTGGLSVWDGDALAYVDRPHPLDQGDRWTALGFDRATGDVFVWSSEGLAAFDMRVMPGQPNLRERPDLRTRAHERIVALPGGRALALPGRSWDKPAAYTVFDVDP